ncbi:hypothetical protein ACFLVN_06180 [Chloroflexota bacterium]
MGKRGILLMVRADVPPQMETEWNNWYDTKHIPECFNNVPGVLTARRFVAIEGTHHGEPKYLTLYDLASVDVLASEAYLSLRNRQASLPPDSFEATMSKLPNFSCGLYQQVYPEQGEYRMPDTEIIDAVGHDPSPVREEEFNAWYNTENMPAIARVPAFVTARRFMAVDTEWPPGARIRLSGPKYIALYDLDNEEVLRSEASLRRRNTPWGSWIRSQCPLRLRFVGRRIYPK